MAQQEKIYYLTKEQYNTLWNNGAKDGSFEHGGTTYTYEENATYYVKEENGEYLPLTGGTINGNLTITGTTNSTGLITQGSPSSDSTITSMNRLEAGLFISGSGSAPNNPKAAGFYLGKSQTDENRHIDIVSGADFSYIDFNQASNVKDFQARCLVNVSTGRIDWQWDSGATEKIFNVNGIIAQNGTTVSLDGHTHNYLPTSGGNLTGALKFYNNSGQLGVQLDYWGLDFQSDNGTLESFINRMPGGVYINNGSMGVVNFDKLSFLTARSDSNSSTFGYGLKGQVLMTNGQGYNNLYWGTVSGGGGSTKLYAHFVSLYKTYYYDGNEREVVSIRYLSTDQKTPLTLSGVATQVHNSSCGGDQLVGIFEQYDEVNYEDSLLSLRPVGVDVYVGYINVYDDSKNWYLWSGQPVKIAHSVREFS